MNVIIVKNKDEGVKKASSIISKEIKNNPKLVLGLATGSTMIPLYTELRGRNLDFSNVTTINLDEYLGLKENDKNSYHYFMKKYFFNYININKKNIFFPNPQIKKLPKINLQVLGIGVNGHIGFNEPGSKINSKLRKVKLSENTRRINSRFFGLLEKVPKYAYTLGIKEIMQSNKIILLAFGRNKSEVIRKTVKDKISNEVPASLLRKHKNVTLIIDKSAARKLK